MCNVFLALWPQITDRFKSKKFRTKTRAIILSGSKLS